MSKKNRSRAVKLAKLGMAGCCGFASFGLFLMTGFKNPAALIPTGIAVSGGMILKDVLDGDDNE